MNFRSLAIAAAGGLLSAHAMGAAGGGRPAAPAEAVPAPAFTHTAASDWLNSPPLTLASLRGNVVLLDFWTYACWNCYRSFPWLNDLEARLHGRGLRVIGVHTPEFDHERVRTNVEEKIAQYGLRHPVMMDNDFSYWKAMGNRYWPAYYLIDRKGRVRAHYAGETHRGDAQARQIEAAIDSLLSEPG